MAIKSRQSAGTLGGAFDADMDALTRAEAARSQQELKRTGGNRQATIGREGKKVNTGTSRRGKSDAELGFIDDVEVRKADGTTTTLGEIDPDVPEVETVAPRKGTQSAKAKNVTTKPVRGGSAAAVQTAAMKKLQAQLDAAQKKAETVEKKAAAAIKAEKEKAAQAKKDAAAAKKQAKQDAAAAKKLERENKAEARKAEIIARREAAKAAKLLTAGETGNAEVDAAFHAAQERALALVTSPVDVNSISLGFLGNSGTQLTATGLIIPADLAIGEWTDLTGGLAAVEDVAGFALGDALLYGDTHYGKQGALVVEDLGIAKQRAKDLKWIAGTFPQYARVPGLSLTHHQEVAGLYAKDPATALNLLQQAAANRPKPHSAKWLRDEVKKLAGGTAGPSKAEKQIAERDTLVLAATAQREEDLANLSPEELAAEEQRERRAVLEYAQANDVVPSDATVRVISRLQGLLYEAQNEAKHWQTLYQELAEKYGEREEAAARVAEYGQNGVDTGEFIAQDDLSFLGTAEDGGGESTEETEETEA